MSTLSFLENKSVALSGVCYENIQTQLSEYNITVVPWGAISALIVGPGCKKRYKYKLALEQNIQIISEASLKCDIALWVERYAPKRVSDIIGNAEAIRALGTWLDSWSMGMSTPKGALVTGPPGIGKTTLANRIASAYGYDIIEFNASNERSASSVKRCFDEASRSSHIGRRRIVIMDEVDGMSSGDRGGVKELARIIRTCTFPIICIANDRTNKKIDPLKSCCLDIRCARPTRTLIAKRLFTTVIQEHALPYSLSDIETLCEQNGNDIRQILNFLQFSSVTPSLKHIGIKDEIQRVDIFSATGRLFGQYGTIYDRLNMAFVDFGMIPLMVAEGYIAAAGKTTSGALSRCIRAAEFIGSGDILDRAMYRTMNWSLLPNILMNSVAAAAATDGPAPFQIFPSWLGKNSRRGKHRRLTATLRQNARCSSVTDELESREVLRQRLFRGCDGKTIVGDLVGLGLTRDDMLETLVETVFTGDEGSVKLDTKIKSAITREWKKRGLDEAYVKRSGIVDSDTEYDGDDVVEELCADFGSLDV